MIKKITAYLFSLAAIVSCAAVVSNDSSILMSKKINVFGVKVLASNGVPDKKLRHAANVMAQYLDNNEDGVPDNQTLVNVMVENGATLVMVKEERDIDNVTINFDVDFAQDLYASEVHIDGAKNRQFDATLEEVLHLISLAGYEELYPETFGTRVNTKQSNAMNIARGGFFESVPRKYPAQAWYSYYDRSCDFECQGGEYFYWALTSLLGAQQADWRRNHIEDEWRLATPAEFKNKDVAMYKLLSDPQYKIPQKLPDGRYQGRALKIETI